MGGTILRFLGGLRLGRAYEPGIKIPGYKMGRLYEALSLVLQCCSAVGTIHIVALEGWKAGVQPWVWFIRII